MIDRQLINKYYAESVSGIREEWFIDKSPRWYEYVERLDELLQIVYLIEVLDSQVINGGFDQYFVNGYGQFAKLTILALVKIDATEKANLLDEALKRVNVENYDDKTFRHKLLNHEIDELYDDEIPIKLNLLDRVYYSKENEIEHLLTEYIQKKVDG